MYRSMRLMAAGAALAMTLGAAPATAVPVDAPPAMAAAAQAEGVLAFWRDAGPAMWFAKDPEFDRRFRERFASLHEAAARGELESWLSTPQG